jgi:hypothetical protein
LELGWIVRFVDPDNEIHCFRREPAPARFTGNLPHVTYFSEQISHCIVSVATELLRFNNFTLILQKLTLSFYYYRLYISGLKRR